jgi:hypothetical protein
MSESIDLTVYNNGANKVLMSANGKIARKPYQFRNSFTNKAGLGNYIKIDLPNISQYGSVLKWTYYPVALSPSGIDAGYFNIKNTNNDNYRLAIWQYSNPSWGYARNSVASNGGNIFAFTTPVPQTQLLTCITIRDNATALFRRNELASSNNAVTQSNAYPINEILIGAIRTANGTTTPTVKGPSTMRHGEFVIFDRELTTGEYLHYYNNKNGNWLQSSIGYKCRVYNDFAEVLDFSAAQDGSDMRVGCRDYSGFNCHGQIMLLPVLDAGNAVNNRILQAAWANANLFTPFIVY